MAVLRIAKKHQNFVVLDKTCLHNTKLSLGAKGLHAYLMSMPDNWRVNVFSLQKTCLNGRDAIRNFLKELEEAGFIKKSLNRHSETGKFGGIEYLVLEVPDFEKGDISPDPEKATADENPENSPATENPLTVKPATGNPSPENPTLINNKDNNKLINKTAAGKIQDLHKDSGQEISAAAVQKLNFVKNKVVEFANFQSNCVRSDSVADGKINKQLTQYQVEMVAQLVKKLNVSESDKLNKEIQFTLLDPQQFKGCGNDFHHKLNSIRLVIQRGDWRTPIGMPEETSNLKKEVSNELSHQLSQAHADMRHFKGLQTVARAELKKSYEEIIEKTLLKIKKLERELEEQMTKVSLAV